MKELVLATHNLGKINELKSLLNSVHCIPQNELGILDTEETGLSFIENAIFKARHASRLSQKPALADDSGLVVPALNGEPGIYSARYAQINGSSEDNMTLLLQRLAGVSGKRRYAYFYCALAIVRYGDDPCPVIATGKLEGEIAQHAQGDGGFGYDPIFYLTEQECTVAELSQSIKNTISHRAMALQKLNFIFATDKQSTLNT